MSPDNERQPVEYGRCAVCGYLMLPVPDIPPCGHRCVVETRPLEEPAVVYSWTRMRLGQDQILVMADFFDGGLRVTAPLLDADSVEIGDRVRLVEGNDTPYAFEMDSRPAGS